MNSIIPYGDWNKTEKLYRSLNIWHNAVMTYQNTDYSIQIRCHGKKPTYHQAYDFLSFDIRMRGDKLFWGVKKFQLIIYERILELYDKVNFYSQNFNLLIKDSKLFKVQLNAKKYHYYFLEIDLDDYSRFNSKKTSSIPISKIFRNNMGLGKRAKYINSIIKTYFNNRVDDKNFKNELHYYINSFYNVIKKGDQNEISQFFDLDYISSFEAARFLMAENGHGTNLKINGLIYWNYTSGKFYPVLHRDVFLGELFNSPIYEHYLNSYILFNIYNTYNQINPNQNYHKQLEKIKYFKQKLPLHMMLNMNDNIRFEKYRKSYELINSYSSKYQIENIDISIKNNRSYFGVLLYYMLKDSYLFNFSGLNRKITHNWNRVRDIIEKSSFELAKKYKRDSLYLKITPDSMAPIFISDFEIRNNTGRNIDLKVYFKNNLLASHKIMAYSSIQMKKYFSHILMSNGVNREGLSYRREYDFEFKINNFKTDPENLRFSIKLKNMISNQLVEKIQLQKRNIPAVPYTSIAGKYQEQLDLHYPNIPFKVDEISKEIHLKKGLYEPNKSILLKNGFKLVLHPGVHIKLKHRQSILSYAGIDIRGTKKNPVMVESKTMGLPFGTIGIIGNGKTICKIDYLIVRGGAIGEFQGVYATGTLSLYHHKLVTITNSIFSNSRAEDAINIKNSEFRVMNNLFKNNYYDQLDLDRSRGIVENNSFIINVENKNKLGEDGLDIGNSKVKVIKNRFYSFYDKAISIGENSDARVSKNTFVNNKISIAVKDLSTVSLIENRYKNNKNDILYLITKKTKIGSEFTEKLNSECLVGNNYKYIFIENTCPKLIRKNNKWGNLVSSGLDFEIIKGKSIFRN